jgi:hypothetical protein
VDRVEWTKGYVGGLFVVDHRRLEYFPARFLRRIYTRQDDASMREDIIENFVSFLFLKYLVQLYAVEYPML